MPIRITNSQSKIAGEILDFSSAVGSTQILNTTMTNAAALELQFEADRTGDVLLMWRGYITNSCSSNVKVDVSMRLLNNSNQPIADTTIDVHRFQKPGSTVGNGIAQLVTAQWLVSVTDGSSYTYKLQAKKTTTTNSIVIDYNNQVTTFEARGL